MNVAAHTAKNNNTYNVLYQVHQRQTFLQEYQVLQKQELIKDEIVTAMNSDKMRTAISNQPNQLFHDELISTIKPLEEELASVKAENVSLRNKLSDMRKSFTSVSLLANANE